MAPTSIENYKVVHNEKNPPKYPSQIVNQPESGVGNEEA